MFFVVRSNDSFNFPLGLIKYIVIVQGQSPCSIEAYLAVIQDQQTITIIYSFAKCFAKLWSIYFFFTFTLLPGKSHDHMPSTSLWGVAPKWLTRAPKTKLILYPRDPEGYSRISLSLSGRILKEYRNIVSTSTCGIPWGSRNRTHWSAAQQESQLVWIV